MSCSLVLSVEQYFLLTLLVESARLGQLTARCDCNLSFWSRYSFLLQCFYHITELTNLGDFLYNMLTKYMCSLAQL